MLFAGLVYLWLDEVFRGWDYSQTDNIDIMLSFNQFFSGCRFRIPVRVCESKFMVMITGGHGCSISIWWCGIYVLCRYARGWEYRAVERHGCWVGMDMGFRRASVYIAFGVCFDFRCGVYGRFVCFRGSWYACRCSCERDCKCGVVDIALVSFSVWVLVYGHQRDLLSRRQEESHGHAYSHAQWHWDAHQHPHLHPLLCIRLILPKQSEMRN